MYKRVKITLWVKIKEKLHAERLHPDNMSATRYFILFSCLSFSPAPSVVVYLLISSFLQTMVLSQKTLVWM